MALRIGNRQICNLDDTFRCPFCPDKKKQCYQFKDLFQHAIDIDASNSRKGSLKAQHRAFTRFIQHDLAYPTGRNSKLRSPPPPMTRRLPPKMRSCSYGFGWFENATYFESHFKDMSESEVDDYAENNYTTLRTGNYRILNIDDTFRCPFFLGKKKQCYQFKDLFQHATGISISNSRKGSRKA
ncbi:hypothetical protein ZIOFF_033135 [Zingiber officinale]|uniref:Zinc finger-XS domain-containing protein n=1 Tax=Zingiber officinale TaxID=94328 RepID=A0A8J5GPT4_ZINOF|nr:hypothetical protein ZIOFF_033135 [Zingiber officinale]